MTIKNKKKQLEALVRRDSPKDSFARIVVKRKGKTVIGYNIDYSRPIDQKTKMVLGAITNENPAKKIVLYNLLFKKVGELLQSKADTENKNYLHEEFSSTPEQRDLLNSILLPLNYNRHDINGHSEFVREYRPRNR